MTACKYAHSGCAKSDVQQLRSAATSPSRRRCASSSAATAAAVGQSVDYSWATGYSDEQQQMRPGSVTGTIGTLGSVSVDVDVAVTMDVEIGVAATMVGTVGTAGSVRE